MVTLWFRGNKAENAAVAGCSGLIIFMDPSTVAMWVILIYRILFLSFYAQHVFFRQGTDEADVYPNTFWMPGTAVQVFLCSQSSPFLPKTISEDHLPWRMETHSPQTGQVLTMLTGRTAAQSLWNLFSKHSPSARLNEEDRREYLPRIPVQPVGFGWNWNCLFSQQVGYTDAEQLLMRMEGEPAPEDWQGGLDMVYKWVENCICRVFDEARLGGELTDELSGGRVTIEVNNRQEERLSSNVIGVLLGSEEPDRCRS